MGIDYRIDYRYLIDGLIQPAKDFEKGIWWNPSKEGANSCLLAIMNTASEVG